MPAESPGTEDYRRCVFSASQSDANIQQSQIEAAGWQAQVLGLQFEGLEAEG